MARHLRMVGKGAREREECPGAATTPPLHRSCLGSTLVGNARGGSSERCGGDARRRRAALVARMGRRRAPARRVAARRRAGAEPLTAAMRDAAHSALCCPSCSSVFQALFDLCRALIV